jgi:hypothetical protein
MMIDTRKPQGSKRLRASLRFQQTNDSTPSSSNVHNIPVIGPILNTPPLLMGGTLWLDPPTPLQWKTIEVCVEAASNKKKDEHEDGQHGIATTDAAPLVAIVQAGSDLASIAAILGYSSTKESCGLDTLDSTSLRESLLAGLVSSTPF